MAGLIDFLVFDLLTADEEKERLAAKRRSVIFERPAEKSGKKTASRKNANRKKKK